MGDILQEWEWGAGSRTGCPDVPHLGQDGQERGKRFSQPGHRLPEQEQGPGGGGAGGQLDI